MLSTVTCAAVALDGAAEKVVEHAEAQRAADGIDPRHAELRHRGGHDREAAGEHGRALGLDADESEARDAAGADHPLAQPRETVGRDAAGGQPVLLEDGGERERRARRGERFAPVFGAELARDRLDERARIGLRGAKRVGAQLAGREEALRHADAAQLQRLEALGRHAAADDELGRAAADVDHEPRLVDAGSTCATPR